MAEAEPVLDVAFIGDESWGTVLERLHSRCDVQLRYIATIDIAAWNTYPLQIAELENIPRSQGRLDRNSSTWDEIRKLELDAVVVAAFSDWVPPDLAPYVMNVHPSMLPEGKGPSPLPHIYAGNLLDIAGVTAHQVTDNLDSGKIIKQLSYRDILPDDATYHDFLLATLGTGAVLLDAVLDQGLEPAFSDAREQEGEGSTFEKESPPGFSATLADLLPYTGLATHIADSDSEILLSTVNNHGLQSLVLSDGVELVVDNARYTEVEHPFTPGEILLPNFAGAQILTAQDGLIYATQPES